MATGYAHYRDAEQRLEASDYARQEGDMQYAMHEAAVAQVHATLALAADAVQPTQWTDPATGTVYDLTCQWLDSDGDTWVLAGWLLRLDGRRVPLMKVPAEPDLCDADLADVIASYGPLTARPGETKADI